MKDNNRMNAKANEANDANDVSDTNEPKNKAAGKKGGKKADENVEAAARHENLVPKTFAVRQDQYDNLTALCAFNKLKRRKPTSSSEVVRNAIDAYFEKDIPSDFKQIM
jgi:hypothetical protein